MDKLIKLAQRAASLQNAKSKLISLALEEQEVKDFILWLNKENQLYDQGIDAEGNIIGYYSAATQAINPEKVAGTPYTLRDTGAFFDSFRIEIGQNEIYITANPIKGNDNLFEKYGEQILGLTDESKEILKFPISVHLHDKIKEYLQNT